MQDRSKISHAAKSFCGQTWIMAGALVLATLMLPSLGHASLTPTIANVPYCSPGGPDQQLDIYNPTNQDPGPWPLLIHIHGGAWSTGDKTLADGGVESKLLDMGWAIASINYRLAPTFQFPAMIEDSKCAVRFLRGHAAIYNFDPNHFLVKGESSGAHLALLVAFAGPAAGWDGGDWPGISSSVDGVWDGYGPFDLSQPDIIANLSGLLDEVFGTSDPNKLLLDSPVNYLTAQAPPVIIVQGELDQTVPVSQSVELYNHLAALGVRGDLILVDNAKHQLLPANTSEPITPSMEEIDGASVTFLTATPPGSKPTFSITPASTTQAVSSGQTATYSVNVTPVGGFSGTVMLSCLGAPTGWVCSAPSSVALDGSNATPVVVTVSAGAQGSLSNPADFPLDGRHLGARLGLASLPAIAILAMALMGYGNRRRVVQQLAVLALMGAGITLASCGGAPSVHPNSVVPVAGTYNLTLIGAPTPGATPVISTAQLVLTVQ